MESCFCAWRGPVGTLSIWTHFYQKSCEGGGPSMLLPLLAQKRGEGALAHRAPQVTPPLTKDYLILDCCVDKCSPECNELIFITCKALKLTIRLFQSFLEAKVKSKQVVCSLFLINLFWLLLAIFEIIDRLQAQGQTKLIA